MELAEGGFVQTRPICQILKIQRLRWNKKYWFRDGRRQTPEAALPSWLILDHWNK